MKDHINILVVGDEDVGKSSLISAYISQHFPQEVPHVLTDATIPPESTQNDVAVTIRDSSAKRGDRDVLHQKIIAADSIIALHDVTRPETFDSLVTYWLPLIRDLIAQSSSNSNSINDSMSNLERNYNISNRDSNRQSDHVMNTSKTQQQHFLYKPVILVGTKTDLLMEEQDTARLNSLLLAFPFVMNCWNCSAVNMQNLENVFFLAELFVNFPLNYILDVTEEEFTPAARRAFLRIFRIFDLDGDNLLCDSELSDTQLRCFDDLINAEELLALKRQISMEVPGGVVNNCVTFEGFVGLIKMNLIAHQYQIPWLILRRFDYDDALNIMIPDEIITLPDMAPNQTTELSPSARAFLLNLAHIAYNETERPISPDGTGIGNNYSNNENNNHNNNYKVDGDGISKNSNNDDKRKVVKTSSSSYRGGSSNWSSTTGGGGSSRTHNTNSSENHSSSSGSEEVLERGVLTWEALRLILCVLTCAAYDEANTTTSNSNNSNGTTANDTSSSNSSSPPHFLAAAAAAAATATAADPVSTKRSTTTSTTRRTTTAATTSANIRAQQAVTNSNSTSGSSDAGHERDDKNGAAATTASFGIVDPWQNPPTFMTRWRFTSIPSSSTAADPGTSDADGRSNDDNNDNNNNNDDDDDDNNNNDDNGADKISNNVDDNAAGSPVAPTAIATPAARTSIRGRQQHSELNGNKFKRKQQRSVFVNQRLLLPGLQHIGATLSFEDWMLHWSLLAINEPVITQVLLFQLGYVERQDLGLVVTAGTVLDVQHCLRAHRQYVKSSPFYRTLWLSPVPQVPAARGVLQVAVLGGNGAGKSSFVWRLSGLRAPGLGARDVEMGADYLHRVKYNDTIVVGGFPQRRSEIFHYGSVVGDGGGGGGGGGASTTCSISGDSASGAAGDRKVAQKQERLEKLERESILQGSVAEQFHVSVAAVPLEHVHCWLQQCVHRCDLVVLLFQCGDHGSFDAAVALEARLPEEVPRLFIGSKTDMLLLGGTTGNAAAAAAAAAVATGTTSSSSSATSSTAVRGEYGNETVVSRAKYRAAHESVLERASLHVTQRQLPGAQFVSSLSGEGMEEACASIVYHAAARPDTATATATASAGYSSSGGSGNRRRGRKGSTSHSMLSTAVVVTAAAAVSLTISIVVIVKYKKEVRNWFSHLVSQSRDFLNMYVLHAARTN